MKFEMKSFHNPEFGDVRTVLIDGAIWFVGKDAATALGYADAKSAISDHVDPEDKMVIQKGQNATFEIPNRGLTVINESGLYSLILSSKLPGAKRFKRWVTAEILPTIHKTGAYQPQALSTAQMFAMQAQVNLEQEQRIKALESGHEQIQNTMQKTLDIFAAPAVSPDDWTAAMNHQVNTLVEQYGGNHRKFRSDLYAELELETGVDLKCRQTRLRNRMRKNGATETECKQISILQVIYRDRKLRPAFESIVRREAAKLISEDQM